MCSPSVGDARRTGVGTPSIQISPDKRYLYLTIPVDEGEQYRIGKIAFSGQLLGREEQLRRLLRTHPGEIFSRTKVGADLSGVGDVFRDLGHAYVNITPLTREIAPQNAFGLNMMRITVDGEPIDDPGRSSEDIQRCTDVALDNASIRMRFDNLEARPARQRAYSRTA